MKFSRADQMSLAIYCKCCSKQKSHEVNPAELPEGRWQSAATAAVSSVSCWHTYMGWDPQAISLSSHREKQQHFSRHCFQLRLLLLTCFLLMQEHSLATFVGD